MSNWLWSLNLLEFVGLLVLAGGVALTGLVVSWLVFVTVEGRQVERRRREQAKRNEEACALWLASEDRQFSKRAAPLIERIIRESQTEAA